MPRSSSCAARGAADAVRPRWTLPRSRNSESSTRWWPHRRLSTSWRASAEAAGVVGAADQSDEFFAGHFLAHAGAACAEHDEIDRQRQVVGGMKAQEPLLQNRYLQIEQQEPDPRRLGVLVVGEAVRRQSWTMRYLSRVDSTMAAARLAVKSSTTSASAPAPRCCALSASPQGALECLASCPCP